MPKSDDTIERRTLETVWVVFHPKAGLVTTEPYEEKAAIRAEALIKLHGYPVYIIETPCIMRKDEKVMKRIYKLERERLDLGQEYL